ncbi:probable ubiquitin-conjugating enzyme E2 24 [Typha angustifolia]|uniref:probable ubiquitin-conjugating enzyme E2 24 n=1 Tax=Typha angustifolia TaxID=59011 RepID=UPI003C2C081F
MDVLVVDSESEGYAESSDSEDQDDGESSYSGHAQNILSNLDESIVKIDDFLAFERGFVHGDIVCSMSDPSGQLGRVVDVDMIVDLEASSGDLIEGVNSKALCRVRSFESGDYVLTGPWIGRVERVFDVVTLVYNDGTKCKMLIKDTELLKPVPPILFEDAPFYYPGQRVRIDLPTTSVSARWWCGSWKTSQDEGTICKVEIGLLRVSWITSVINDSNCSATPPRFQEPKNLTLLSFLSYANWQLGDWCTLPVDCFHSLQMNADKSATLITAPESYTKMKNRAAVNGQDHKQTYLIVRTKSKLDVLWQNGDLSVRLDPRTLFPVNNLGDHDFWPGQLVDKVRAEEVCVQKQHLIGVVRNVDALEKTVKVKWAVPELKQVSGVTRDTCEETVSAYELIEHPDFSYCIGDVVLRSVLDLNYMDNHAGANHIGHIQGNGVILDVLKVSVLGNYTPQKMVADGSNEKDFHHFLSYVGNVIGYKDEGIEVRWANGLISKVQPFEIFGLNRLVDAVSSVSANEESFHANLATEMVEQEKQLCHKIAEVVDDSSEDCFRDLWKSTALLFRRTAFGFLTNVAASLFSAHCVTPPSGSLRESSQYQILKTEELQSGVDNFQLECLKQQKEVVEQNEKLTSPIENDKITKFKQFDVINESSDHHFANGIGTEKLSSQVRRGWLKRIQQEWSILENGLPDSIFVRVYEERMDLLRACIVGAAGTPYHDGLFFFDILFPLDYPREPPSVHYISGGLRLNPNLYESGKVCLSLLKTWTGTGTEVWNSDSSTILQLLLSLQALVLNEKPYFNEAGYDKQIGRAEGEKNSISYNENAFLLSCKSMLYLLQKPPKHFEKLVEEHFTRRSLHILAACKSYLDGAQVGRPCDSGMVSGEDHKTCSTGFKIMLAKLLPKLMSAFDEMGGDRSQFIEQFNEIPRSGKE